MVRGDRRYGRRSKAGTTDEQATARRRRVARWGCLANRFLGHPRMPLAAAQAGSLCYWMRCLDCPGMPTRGERGGAADPAAADGQQARTTDGQQARTTDGQQAKTADGRQASATYGRPSVRVMPGDGCQVAAQRPPVNGATSITRRHTHPQPVITEE